MRLKIYILLLVLGHTLFRIEFNATVRRLQDVLTALGRRRRRMAHDYHRHATRDFRLFYATAPDVIPALRDINVFSSSTDVSSD